MEGSSLLDNENSQIAKSILDDYDKNAELYDEFRLETQRIIEQILKTHTLDYHQISSRRKDRDSFEKKVYNDVNKYKSLHEITDIAGVRVITYLENSIDDIARIIREEFQIDEQKSVDKRKHKEDSFGYKSLHYVIQFSSQRTNLGENRKYKGLKVEIQIRSILQHAWASIEHKLAYKNPIPEQYKRDFNRISALLETADLGFVSLENNITTYRKAVDAEVKRRTTHIELNTVSLDAFIKSNALLKEIEDIVYPKTSTYGLAPIYDLYMGLDYLGIDNINDLEAHLQRKKEAVIYLASEIKSHPVAQVGFSMRYLAYVLAAERGGKKLIEELLVATNRRHTHTLSELYMRRYEEFMQLPRVNDNS